MKLTLLILTTPSLYFGYRLTSGVARVCNYSTNNGQLSVRPIYGGGMF